METDARPTTMLDAALALAARGFHVLPLNGKVPRTRSGSKDATTREEQIRQWWGWWPTADIGIATGHDDLLVIDVDGPEGAKNLSLLEQRIGSLPDSSRVRTSRGLHIYLKCPKEVRNSQARSDGWDGIDIRGIGGFVVAPPSVHQETGHVYEWIDGPLVEELPAAWEAELTRARTRVTTPNRIAGGGAKIPVGQRHQAMVSLAGAMRRKGMSHEAMFAGLRAEVTATFEDGESVPDENIWRAVRDMDAYVAEDPVEALSEALSLAAQLEDMLASDKQAATRPDMIAALSTLKDEDLSAWTGVCDVLRRHKQLRWVEQGIKRHKAQVAAQKLEEMKQRGAEIDDAPIKQADPERFHCNATGVWAVVGDNGDALERILHVPLYITARLKDIETGEERIALAWKRDGVWASTNCDASLAASAQRIVALADHGLPIDSGSAGQVVRYLTAVAAANPEIPVRLRSERTGWIGSSRFWPGAADDIEFDPRDQSLKHVIAPSGTLAEWVDIVKPLRERYPLLRLQLSASFAGPLLEKTGSRGFVVHLWGQSGSGKTAVLTCAASVWGSAKFMKSFMTTRYALTVNAAERTGLPLCINEKQLANFPADRVLYELVEGVSKGQGARDGGTRAAMRWLSPILTNGESPITNRDSEQGTRTRAIEIAGEPIDSEAVAASLYSKFAAQHGTAGPEFVSRLIRMDTEQIRSDLAMIRECLDNAVDGHLRTHVASLAVVALADCYAGTWIFGIPAEQSLMESAAWALQIMEDGLERKGETDQAERAYQEVSEWVYSLLGTKIAPTRDTATPGYERLGYLENGWAWVLTSFLSAFLEQSPNRSHRGFLRDMDRKDLIRKERNGKDWRYSIRGAGGQRYNVLRLDPEILDLAGQDTDQDHFQDRKDLA
jgi:putative DNA primase/helicase